MMGQFLFKAKLKAKAKWRAYQSRRESLKAEKRAARVERDVLKRKAESEKIRERILNPRYKRAGRAAKKVVGRRSKNLLMNVAKDVGLGRGRGPVKQFPRGPIGMQDLILKINVGIGSNSRSRKRRDPFDLI